MITNLYFIRARLFPTVLTAAPQLILVNKLLSVLYYDTLKNIIEVLPILTSLGLSVALLFLSIQINRLLAKEIFQRLYFNEEIKMPTTDHLLWSDQFFDETVKEKIRSKIADKFRLTLMDKNEEASKEATSRKQIVTAVSQIRNSLRGNKLLLQHNIEYGFFRNLIGGCVIAVICSVVLILFGHFKNEPGIKLTGIILFFIYLLPIILSKQIINRFGNYYSKVLYEQFLTL
jgi:hypothetical protein